jgi:hypothetical protein
MGSRKARPKRLVDNLIAGLGQLRHAVLQLDQAALGQQRQIVVIEGGQGETLRADISSSRSANGF